MTTMPYRRIGRSGLRLSALSFGSWVTFDGQMDLERASECMQAARDHGVNFFDTAESYGLGRSETVLGQSLANLGWARHSYVVSTKLFKGLHADVVNMSETLNRKYLLHAIDGSLERLGLEFVDVLFCHRPDPETPISETVWAMHDLVSAGKALYWGTSEWPATAIREAHEVAERHHLHAPIVEQPEYNILSRERVEVEYADLYTQYGMGTTTWSPLASGLLTGKYLDGVPSDSRANVTSYEWLRDRLTDEGANARVAGLKRVADDLDVSPAQLSIAWCLKNENVSSVITGASRVEQVHQNMAALDVVPLLDGEVVQRINAAVSVG